MIQPDVWHFALFLIGGAIGIAVAVGFYRGRARDLQEARDEVKTLRGEKEDLQRSESQLQVRETELTTRLEEERKATEDRQQFLEESQQVLTDTFEALSARALKSNQENFLQLAKTNLEKYQEAAKGDLARRQEAIGNLVKPMHESLSKVDEKIQHLEKQRVGAYAELKEQVSQMVTTQKSLQQETGQLVKALRKPTGRGQWGEMQLRRVVEMAGMQEHCDFETQTTTSDDEGKRLRPDLIVKLPGGKQIVVDSKAPMDAYLDAVEARERSDEEVERESMARHARQVKTHVDQLGSKAYQAQFEPTPEFVVLFLPSESFFSDALAQDPGLIEGGVDKGVILATPTTLIALLRAVAYGWRQESLAENAREVSALGRQLYERLTVMGGHFAKLGRSLSGGVEAYNKVLGTLETRVMVTARKFKDLEVAPSNKELETLEPIETLARDAQLPDLSEKEEGEGTGAEPPIPTVEEAVQQPDLLSASEEEQGVVK